jgi:hypothetical protein
MYQHIIGTGGLHYICHKGGAMDFVPQAQSMKPAFRARAC